VRRSASSRWGLRRRPSVVRHVGASKPAAKPSRRRGDERPESYVVERGDTLFGIALDFGFDYRELAAWNEISRTPGASSQASVCA
jgi:LysM repeat protein